MKAYIVGLYAKTRTLDSTFCFLLHSAGDALDYGPFNSRSLSLMARLLTDEVAVPFGVVIREDKRVENEESFTAQLSLPELDGLNVKLGAITRTTVFIKDNDSKRVNQP